MDAIYWLIPLTLVFLLIALAILFWAINNDQYADLDKEASQILFDDEQFDIEPLNSATSVDHTNIKKLITKSSAEENSND